MKEIIRDVIKDELKININSDSEINSVDIMSDDKPIASDAVRIDNNIYM